MTEGIAVPAVTPASVTAVSIVLPALSALSYCVRIYDRRCRRRIPLAKDDWALLISLLGLWALAIVNLVGVGIGALGKHSERRQPGDPRSWTIHRTRADDNAETIVQIYSFIEKFAFFAYKASVCFAYRRIFPYRTLQRICLGVLVFLGCQCVSFVIATALQCRSRNWGVWYLHWALAKRCAQEELVWVGYTVSEVAVDLFLLFSPMPYLLKMNLTRAKKVSTIVVFSMGGLSVAVGIARMSYLLAFTYTGDRGYRDLMGLQSTMLVWSLTECAVAIIASNIAAMRNLIFRNKHGQTKEFWLKLDSKISSSPGNPRFLGSDLSDERRGSVGRALMGERSRSVGSRCGSLSGARSASIGPPVIRENVQFRPTYYGRKGSWW